LSIISSGFRALNRSLKQAFKEQAKKSEQERVKKEKELIKAITSEQLVIDFLEESPRG
jgi:hypothetical protein